MITFEMCLSEIICAHSFDVAIKYATSPKFNHNCTMKWKKIASNTLLVIMYVIPNKCVSVMLCVSSHKFAFDHISVANVCIFCLLLFLFMHLTTVQTCLTKDILFLSLLFFWMNKKIQTNRHVQSLPETNSNTDIGVLTTSALQISKLNSILHYFGWALHLHFFAHSFSPFIFRVMGFCMCTALFFGKTVYLLRLADGNCTYWKKNIHINLSITDTNKRASISVGDVVRRIKIKPSKIKIKPKHKKWEFRHENELKTWK